MAAYIRIEYIDSETGDEVIHKFNGDIDIYELAERFKEFMLGIGYAAQNVKKVIRGGLY